jgi:hypothetical protein
MHDNTVWVLLKSRKILYFTKSKKPVHNFINEQAFIWPLNHLFSTLQLLSSSYSNIEMEDHIF